MRRDYRALIDEFEWTGGYPEVVIRDARGDYPDRTNYIFEVSSADWDPIDRADGPGFRVSCPFESWVKATTKKYNPLKVSGLFKTFSEITSDDQIISFATQWGLLRDFTRGWAEGKTSYADDDFCGDGDPLSLWYRDTSLMRTCVWLLDALQNQSESSLKLLMQEPDSDFYRGPSEITNEFVLSEIDYMLETSTISGVIYELEDEGRRRPPLDRAAYLLWWILDRKLRQCELKPYVTLGGRATKPMDLALKPSDLQSALWLQLTKAVCGDKQYRRCAECDFWFEVSLDQTGCRKSRLYCGDPCKMKAYRKRRQEAIRLIRNGCADEEIAERVGSKLGQIKKWREGSGRAQS